MSISPQMLRSMRDELTKIAQGQGPYRTAAGRAAEQTAEKVKRPGLKTNIHRDINAWGQGMEQRANRVVQRLSGAKKKVVEDTAGEAVEGAKKKLMTSGGTPNTQMRQFGQEMGSEATEGVLKKLRPSGKMMALGGAGALAAGGLAAYGVHRARKRRDSQIQQAVAAGIRQGQT